MAMYPKLFGILKLQKDYLNRNEDGDDEDFVEGATTTSSQHQDDGESLSETAQSRTPSPNNTNVTTPVQSPSMCSSPDQNTPPPPQPPPSAFLGGDHNDEGKTQDYESGHATIKQEMKIENDSRSNGGNGGGDEEQVNNNNNNNTADKQVGSEALPKLRLNTMLASDPALKPEAKDIKDRRASTEDNSNDDKNDDGFHNHADHDMEIKGIRLIKERSNNIIVPPPIIASPSLDSAPRMQVFMCGPCGIRFSSLSTLEAHQTYYCSHRKDADENVAPQKPSANNDSGASEPPNKSIKTGKQYACTQCSYSADKKVSLNRHMRMHQTSPAPSPNTTNGGLVVVSAGSSLPNADDTLNIPSQIQQQQLQQQQQQHPQQNQVQQIDRYCSDCDIRFSSTKTYRAHKQHYCSSRHRDENRSNSTTPKPPSIKRGSHSPPDAQPVAKSPAIVNPPPNPVQPYLALPTNPIIIVPYTFIRNASVLTGPLASIPTSVTNPESTCFIFQNGALQPIAVALSPPIAQPTQQTPTQNVSPRGPTPNQATSNENSNNASNTSETVLKVSNKRDLTARETITTPLDLSVRRLSPGSNPRERSFSFSSIASLENHRIDIDSIMETKENLSMGGSESVTPEQIVCAPSLPGSPPLTPSPKRRSNSPRGGTTSISPNNSLPSSGSSQHQVVIRSLIPPELALRLSEPSALAAMPSHALAKQNLELSLRLSSAGSNSEISPQPTPPLISIIPNPATSNAPTAIPPQIFVKQGVSKCKECNIVFCKYENYLAHKKHYCSARNLDETENSKPSPPVSPQATSPSGSGTLAYQQLICAACGIKFTALDNLSAHQLYYCPKRAEMSMPMAKESRCNKCKNIHETGAPCPNNVGVGGSGTNPSNRKCPICDVVTSTSNELRKHMETHGGVKAFRCTICRYKGNTLRGMRTHIRMHFDKKTSDFNEENYISCILDEDGIEIPAQPLLAISQAPPVIPPPPPPPLSMPILQDPISSQQIHYCDLCNYSSSFKGNVIRHINLVHATNRPPLSPSLGEGGESLLFNGDLQTSPAQLQFNSAKTAQPTNKLMNEISVKQEPLDEPQLIEDSRDTIISTEPEILIKTEIKDTIDTNTTMPIMSPLIQTITQPLLHQQQQQQQQHSASSSPDLQSLTTAGPKYCKQCDIKFNYLSTFIAHKQFYCKSGISVGVERENTGSSPTQSANNNNNSNNVVTRATEASVL